MHPAITISSFFSFALLALELRCPKFKLDQKKNICVWVFMLSKIRVGQ